MKLGGAPRVLEPSGQVQRYAVGLGGNVLAYPVVEDEKER